MASFEGLLWFFGGILGNMMSIILFALFLIPAAVNLIIEIIGVKKSSNPLQASFFIVTGIVLSILSLIIVVAMGPLNLPALVMPALFIIGGCLYKRAAASFVH